jgi:hypothetical protein
MGLQSIGDFPRVGDSINIGISGRVGAGVFGPPANIALRIDDPAAALAHFARKSFVDRIAPWNRAAGASQDVAQRVFRGGGANRRSFEGPGDSSP